MPYYPPPGASTDATLTFTDVTTNDASTSKHGFLKKLDNIATNFMNGAGNWAAPATALTAYRKVTAKTVNTTVSETDLFNGEITVAGNAIGATGVLRITAAGDWKQNSGGTAAFPRLKLKFGATTLFDTGAIGTFPDAATRYGWVVEAEIANLTASTQSAWFRVTAGGGDLAATSAVLTTGTGVMGTSRGATGNLVWANGRNSGALDTTGALALVLSVINGSANANYETKLYNALAVVL